MKRLILILIAATGFALNSNAQFIDNGGELYVENNMFYLNGMPLNDGEVLAIIGDDVYNNVYLPARKKIKSAETIGYIGGTMMGVGVGLAAGDLVSSALYGTTGDSRRYLVYGGITLVGLIPTLVSFSMVKNGRSAYTRIAETYNKCTGRTTELNLGPAGSGLGIALNF